MSTFMQYAIMASGEALEDAGWRPETNQQREMTVSQDSFNLECDDSAKLTVSGRVSRLWYWKSRGAISDLGRSLSRRESYSTTSCST